MVAIDGKQARGTKDTQKKPLHVVSAFASESRLILGQLACEEKSNEITAIPKLLEMLEIQGCIVTIDAMGTQTEIASKITEKGADYILAVKENQGILHKDIKLYFDAYRQELRAKDRNSYACEYSQGHGRYERRECYICEEINWLTNRKKWSNLNGIGVICCRIEENGRISTQNHYFIYSCKGVTAKQIMQSKRAQWSIENGLHWILDMEFREDESRARKDNSAENLNVLRHIAYNALKGDKSMKGSISSKQFMCALDNSYLDKIVRSCFFL